MLHYFCNNNDTAAFLRHDAPSILLFSPKYHSLHNLVFFPLAVTFTFYTQQRPKFKYPPHRIKVVYEQAAVSINTLYIQHTQIKRLRNVNLPYLLRYMSPFRYTIHRHEICDVLTSVTEETSLLITDAVSLGKQAVLLTLRCVKEGLVRRAALYPVGETGGVHLLGLLREQQNAYLGSSSLDPDDIKS